MKEKREKMRREVAENIANEYSFTPEINETSKHLALKYGDVPLHERVNYFNNDVQYGEVMKNKKENIKRLRMQTEQPMNYAPAINEKSKEIIFTFVIFF